MGAGRADTVDPRRTGARGHALFNEPEGCAPAWLEHTGPAGLHRLLEDLEAVGQDPEAPARWIEPRKLTFVGAQPRRFGAKMVSGSVFP